MLAFIFRGVFLVGVLSWYSSSMWKMIDGYFKDQFQRYLQTEYQKNPKMRADFEAYRAAGKEDSVTKAALEKQVREVIETCPDETCPIFNAETSTKTGSMNGDNTGCGSEDEVKRESIDETDRQQATMTNVKEARIRVTKSINSMNEKTSKNAKEVVPFASDLKIQKKKRRSSSLKPPDVKTNEKMRVKTIVLREEDFRSIRSRVKTNDDFTEFDVGDAEMGELPPGAVLVSELPFKPKADIGDLEMVNEEEYCPLKMEEMKSCKKVNKWP